MKTYEINEEQVKLFINYLMTRPMAEVEQGVQLLRNLKEIHSNESLKLVDGKEES